jgi:hypothetical protein
MTQTKTQIRCPNCNTPLQAIIEQLIDVGMDPMAKSRLLSGNFNFIQCPTCGYSGQLATPIVYHDPEKELLLTFMPVEIAIPKEEQEKAIGALINQVIDKLPAEQRKGYLLQPQAVLTLQGLIERVLEADGITKEDLDAQKAKLRLFEDLLKLPEDQLPGFVGSHDTELDGSFFQLASLSLQTTPDQRARQAAANRLEDALNLTTYGKKLKAQQEEIQAAIASLQEAGENLTHSTLLELFIEAPNPERVNALTNLTRPALDYTFFQSLTERIDSAEGEEKERLSDLRVQVLELTQEIDKAQEARIGQASQLLQGLLDAEDQVATIKSALPLIDDLFLSVLQANINAAAEQSAEETLEALQNLDNNIQQVIQETLPPGLRLAQQLLEFEDEQKALQFLQESPELVDESTQSTLMAAAQRYEEQGDESSAARARNYLRHALRITMKRSMADSPSPEVPTQEG